MILFGTSQSGNCRYPYRPKQRSSLLHNAHIGYVRFLFFVSFLQILRMLLILHFKFYTERREFRIDNYRSSRRSKRKRDKDTTWLMKTPAEGVRSSTSLIETLLAVYLPRGIIRKLPIPEPYCRQVIVNPRDIRMAPVWRPNDWQRSYLHRTTTRKRERMLARCSEYLSQLRYLDCGRSSCVFHYFVLQHF